MTKQGEHFLHVIGAAKQGRYGCEIWVSHVRPLGHRNGNPIRATADSISVLHDDPRRLVIRLHTPVLSAFIACIHGPHQLDETYAAW